MEEEPRPLPDIPPNVTGDDDGEGGLYDVIVDHSPRPAKPPPLVSPKPPPVMTSGGYAQVRNEGPPGAPNRSASTAAGRKVGSPHGTQGSPTIRVSQDNESQPAGPVYQDINRGDSKLLTAKDMMHEYDDVSAGSTDDESDHPPKTSREEPELDYEEVTEHDFAKPCRVADYEDVTEQDFVKPAAVAKSMQKELGSDEEPGLYETVKPSRPVPKPPEDDDDTGGVDYEDVTEQVFEKPAMAMVEHVAEGDPSDVGLYETVKPQRKTSLPQEDTYETVKPKRAMPKGRSSSLDAAEPPPAKSRKSSYEMMTEKELGEDGLVRPKSFAASREEPTYMYSSVNVKDVRGAPSRRTVAAPSHKVRPLHLLDGKSSATKPYTRPPEITKATSPSVSSGSFSLARQDSVPESIEEEEHDEEESAPTAADPYAVVQKPRATSRSEESAGAPATKERRKTPPSSVHRAVPKSSSPNLTPRLPSSAATKLSPKSTKKTAPDVASKPTHSKATSPTAPAPKTTKPVKTPQDTPVTASNVTVQVRNPRPGGAPRSAPKPGRKSLFSRASRASRASPPSSPSTDKKSPSTQQPWWKTPPSSPLTSRSNMSESSSPSQPRDANEQAPAVSPQHQCLQSPPSPPRTPPPPILDQDLDVEDVPLPPLPPRTDLALELEPSGEEVAAEQDVPTPVRLMPRGQHPPPVAVRVPSVQAPHRTNNASNNQTAQNNASGSRCSYEPNSPQKLEGRLVNVTHEVAAPVLSSAGGSRRRHVYEEIASPPLNGSVENTNDARPANRASLGEAHAVQPSSTSGAQRPRKPYEEIALQQADGSAVSGTGGGQAEPNSSSSQLGQRPQFRRRTGKCSIR